MSKVQFFFSTVIIIPICGLAGFIVQAFAQDYFFSLFSFSLVFLSAFLLTFVWAYRKYSRYHFAGDEHDSVQTGDPRLMAAFTLVISVLFYSLIILFLFPDTVDYAFGRLEYQKEYLTEGARARYRGPKIPESAQDIHISQSGWSEDWLIVTFKDTEKNMRAYIKYLDLDFKQGVSPPEKSFYMSYCLKDDNHFFINVTKIVNGVHYLKERGKYSAYHGEFMALDLDENRFYYLKW